MLKHQLIDMKNFTTRAAFLLSGGMILFSQNALTNSSGAPAGHSGSPGDNNQTCTQCHGGGSIGSQSISVEMKQNGNPVTEYNPGETYQVEVELALNGAGNPVGGFQASVESAGGNKVGSIVVTDANRTQKVVNNITHKTAGINFSSGSLSYSFDWQAPTSGVGDVTVYVAANFANGNGTTSGDAILTRQQTISQSTLGDREQVLEKISLYPNPAKDIVTVQFEVTDPQVKISVIDLSGAVVMDQYMDAGNGHVDLQIDHLSTGRYLILVRNGDRSYSGTLLKK